LCRRGQDPMRPANLLANGGSSGPERPFHQSGLPSGPHDESAGALAARRGAASADGVTAREAQTEQTQGRCAARLRGVHLRSRAARPLPDLEGPRFVARAVTRTFVHSCAPPAFSAI
jgi:hypothetical protein